MLPKGYMSEIKKYQRLTLGETEQFFIRMFAEEPLTTWEIAAYIKTMKVKHLAYKNVHDRVKRLLELGLIKEHQIMPRRAIKYRLTSRGLFERLMLDNFIFPLNYELYKDNIIMHTLLYQYFEPVTISKFGKVMTNLVTTYLTDCCNSILRTLEFFNDKDKDFGGDRHEQFLCDAIEGDIKNRIENLVAYTVKVAAAPRNPSPELPVDWYDERGISKQLCIEDLINDNKFMETLHRIKQNFDRGYKKFIT